MIYRVPHHQQQILHRKSAASTGMEAQDPVDNNPMYVDPAAAAVGLVSVQQFKELEGN